jgi:hypothetical protein
VTTEVHPDDGPLDAAAVLLDTTRRVAARWLRRVTVEAATRGGVSISTDDPELSAVVGDAVDRLLTDLETLLDTDVDEQRTNPLSIFRAAVGGPTAFLVRRGATPPVADGFTSTHFPDDVFGLGPASWSDIDPELHEPGITWGAWKALTVLRRRRDEGLR